ncbi:MAG: Maf family protein [Fusobacteriaceae bacterium]
MILASKSPRRLEILEEAGIKVIIDYEEIEEVSDKVQIPDKIMDIARKKAFAIVEKHKESFVLSADTVVVLNGQILGKPKDKKEAIKTLKNLSGKNHKVITAYSLINLERGIEICDYAETEVRFKELSEEVINWYVETGEPMDKAGSYGIQGKGAILVESIKGDFYTVMGLPISKILNTLIEIGIKVENLEKI